MFLRSLKIDNNGRPIREIGFHKGLNLIVDDTITADLKESGNNVGKTTVLRLIDYCLASDGKSIYKDPEFRSKTNTEVENFLKNNDIFITLKLAHDLEDNEKLDLTIRRNFQQKHLRIQEINGEVVSATDFPKRLKELIFDSTADKPTFRQIIAKNIRDAKERLTNTVKVLPAYAKNEEYEAVFLFWLGIELDESSRKQALLRYKKIEESLQERLRKESSISQINQSLILIEKNISELSEKRNKLSLDEKYEENLASLNEIKYEINRRSTELSRLEMRKELIEESKQDLEKELSGIDVERVKKLYQEAKVLMPNIQRTFEETLKFHNEMVSEKIRYISEEMPALDREIKKLQKSIKDLLAQEKTLTAAIQKVGLVDDLQIVRKLNDEYEKKGKLEEQKRLWESTLENLKSYGDELEAINKGISSKDELIQSRIAKFNQFFSAISLRLYGEQFVLSADKNEKGYELNISSLSGNLGTGKKKGQIAAFDLAYIQFAEDIGLKCLHFILHDQIENIHDNQISNILTNIVEDINCQYVLPVLRDKLPKDVTVEKYEILSLSQTDKLFKLK